MAAWRVWGGALVIIVLTLLAYAPALSAGFVWDDDSMLTENPLMTDKDGLFAIWFTTRPIDYFPLTLTSLWAEWRLWGMRPEGYHATNILLHGLASVFLWGCLRRLAVPGAWLAAAAFALHPVNVESVAWIAERKNTLSMMLYALAWWLYLKSEPRTDAAAGAASSPLARRWYAASLAVFLLALLAKTSVVMLPVVLLGCALWQRGSLRREDWLRTLPFFGLSLALALVTIWFQYHRAISTDVGGVNTHNFAQRLMGAGWAVWFYLGKALWPAGLAFVYPRWTLDARMVAGYLPGVLLLGVLALCWWRRQTVWGRALFFGLGYFVVTLFPVLGFFNIYFQKYSLVADHWQYQSLPGVLALVVGGAAGFLAGRGAGQGSAGGAAGWLRSRGLKIVLGTALLAVLGTLTWRQAQIYRNDETLWTDTLRKNPGCWMAWNGMGQILAARNQQAEAVEAYQKGVALKPDHAEGRNNLAVSFIRMGKFPEAREQFRLAVASKPDLGPALKSLAWMLATHPDPRLRDGREAVQHGEAVARLTEHKNPGVLDILAAAYAEAGQFTKAVETARQALALAQAENEPGLEAEIRVHLGSFERRRPWRDMP